MKLIISLVALLGIFSLFAPHPLLAEGTNPPCLVGQGPLSPGQEYCGDTVKLLGIDLGCYAQRAPSEDGCGLDDLIVFLRRLINYLTVIVIPLVAAMVVWGGLVIMTAAGSVEKVSSGRQVIKTAVIGLIIALGSWLIINAIYLALTGIGV